MNNLTFQKKNMPFSRKSKKSEKIKQILMNQKNFNKFICIKNSVLKET